MRNRISTNIRLARFLFVALGIGLLFDLTYTIFKNDYDQEKIIVEIVFLIINSILYYLFDKAKTVEFDDDFMYVTGKAGEEKIPLKDIYKIKLTLAEINDRNMWKIGYYDNSQNEKIVRILPAYPQFDNFKKGVMAANKDLKIRNWSHSFDIDQ